jgi:hypothetical protein
MIPFGFRLKIFTNPVAINTFTTLIVIQRGIIFIEHQNNLQIVWFIIDSLIIFTPIFILLPTTHLLCQARGAL